MQSSRSLENLRTREPADPKDDLDVNAAIWGIFLNTTLQAAVHLGQDYEVNWRFVKNHLWNSVEQLFNETGRLIRDQTEITAYQIANAKTYIFSDSVLCVGKMGDDPIATWKNKIWWYSEKNHFKELNRMDGMPTELEWKIFPGFTTLGLFEKIQDLMKDLQRQDHLHVKVERHSMGTKKETQKGVNTIQRQLRIVLVDSLAVVGLSWELAQKRNGTELALLNPTDPGTQLQKKWWWISQNPVTRYFVPPVSLREERRKHRVASPHDNSCKSAKCLRSNSRSVQGTIRRFWGPGESWSSWSCGNDEVSYWPFCCRLPHQRTATGKLDARLRAQIRTIVRWPEVIQTMLWRWFEDCRNRTIHLHTSYRKEMGCNSDAENTQCLDAKRVTRGKGRILKNTRILSVLDIKVCHHEHRYSIEVLVESLFQDHTASWVWIVSGIGKYVTESMQTREERHRASGRPVAKTRPRQTPTVTLSSVSIPVRERKWIDIETQRSHDQKCHQVSQAMTRLPRHDRTVPWQIDGAVLVDDVLEECRKKKIRWCFAMVTWRMDINSGKRRRS